MGDFLYVVMFTLGCVLVVMGNASYGSEFGGEITGSLTLDASLLAGMAFLFLVDGLLLILFMRHVQAWVSGTYARSKLAKEVIINVATNSVSFLAYLAWRVLVVVETSAAEAKIVGAQFAIIKVVFVVVILLKFTKIMVMASFARFLRAQSETTLSLCMSPVPANAVQPIVAAQPMATAAQPVAPA